MAAKNGQRSSLEPPSDRLLSALIESTAGETGEAFFRALVTGVSDALQVYGAWVTEYLPEKRKLRALAFRLGDQWVPDFEYELEGTPCGASIANRELLYVADRVVDLFPDDNDLKVLRAVSYIGSGFFDEEGEQLLGHLAIIHTRPLPDTDRYARVFKIFASRAGAELRRMNLEAQLRARTEELDAVFESALDVMLILNHEHEIVRLNTAAASVFGSADLVGQLIDRVLSVDGAVKMEPILETLFSDSASSGAKLWIPGGVEARSVEGGKFAVEGTLSRFELRGRPYATLILRSIKERLESEARLKSLSNQSAYLREEVEKHFGEIIGESGPMRRLMKEIAEVAVADVAVLITGETGAGKELVARAVHRASARGQAPLIKVNCAAIPEHLIESEFFGHEKGAFTGATARREGRFQLADGGTLFLDEIGELPPGLQAKLLRVLQEGEFEPVGSSRTIKVDVRIIAATNRDLQKDVKTGAFREDLYYRIGVFLLHVPPLRDRGKDIELLASFFAERFCNRLRRTPISLAREDLERLRSYNWPGNVRELGNVIERAVITGDGTRLNLNRAMPAGEAPPELPRQDAPPTRILTMRELEQAEAENFRRALERARGRISGPAGAADILGIKPTTLRSRLKALGMRTRREIS